MFMLNVLVIVLLGLICYYIYKFFKMAEDMKLYVTRKFDGAVPINELTAIYNNLKSSVGKS